MAQTIHITRTETIDDLRLAIKQSKDDAQKNRLRAIIKILQGMTRTHVAREFVVCRDTVIHWIQSYNAQGPNGLLFSKGGRKEGNPKWDTTIFNELKKEINNQKQYWSIPIMMTWIKDKYGINIPEQTVWYHMDKLNMSYKSARPHPHLGDKDKQELFKKGA